MSNYQEIAGRKNTGENDRKQKQIDAKITKLLSCYAEDCNKTIDNWNDFTVDDIKRELAYCTEYFMLMKIGDTIKCDCGEKSISLDFEHNEVVYYKEGKASPTERQIPRPVKGNMVGCFGKCLLETPSRHPGINETGGNACVPYIVGASWLNTYNNVKIGELRTVLHKRSWLACKYMGRIMSADEVMDIDVTGMTEDEAFNMMLRWVQGEHIPQVLLDKITLIYAGGDEAVKEYWNQFEYKGASYKNFDKYDTKFVAWSKFVNNLWEGEQKASHLEIRPVLLKAMSMKESSMGNDLRFNGTVNIMQSLTIGDGTLWHFANCNPYQYTYEEDDRKKIIVNQIDGGSIEKGWVQFTEENYFTKQTDEEGNISYDRTYQDSKYDYLGKVDTGNDDQSIFGQPIKYIESNSDSVPKQTILVVYPQQSIDMSVCASAIVLANKGNKEEAAVNAYNGNNPNYAGKIEDFLKDFGTDFVN